MNTLTDGLNHISLGLAKYPSLYKHCMINRDNSFYSRFPYTVFPENVSLRDHLDKHT